MRKDSVKAANDQHYIVQAGGSVHVIPRSVFERVASGEMQFEEIDEWRAIMKKVLREWMEFLGALK